jgi:histidinol-phosphatase (PHP family)
MIDYHVHLWPHAMVADEAELAAERISGYLERAAGNGVREIALTEHFFRFRKAREVVEGWWDDFDEPQGRHLRAAAEAYFDHHATADLDHYVETATALKSAGMPVVVGLEVDYYAGRMGEVARLLAGYPFDVLLGSVHWIDNWMFDVLDQAVAQQEWDHRSLEETWRAYGEAIEELAGSGACDVLAHPDVVKLTGRLPDRGVVEDCEARIAEAAGASGMAAEVSSAGLRRPCQEVYPSRGLLERFLERGVAITFASDSHGSTRVGERSSELRRFAAEAGYSQAARFSERRPELFSFTVPEADDSSGDAP